MDKIKRKLEHPIGSPVLVKHVKRNTSDSEDTDSVSNDAKKLIGQFFFENGVDLDAVESPSFESMITKTAGLKMSQIPTSEELKGWLYSDSMKDINDYMREMRNSWAHTGCSILLDGWKDAKGRTLVNVLVNCPKGTVYLRSYDISDHFHTWNIDALVLFVDEVVVEVGVENVVQIITFLCSDFMKRLGNKLKEKYKSIFFTIGASCCIELMLEKFGAMGLIGDTLEKSKAITKLVESHPKVLQNGNALVPLSKLKSTLPFLTLENIIVEKDNLKSASLISTVEGKRVADLVGDKSFWNAATIVVKATIPLVHIMELLNKNKANMGYIYDTIDQAKETIKSGLQHKKSQYMPFWNVIDEVWDHYLYSAVHAAGYFLNPKFFYSTDAYMDSEIATGLLSCIIRVSEDSRELNLITEQLEEYRKAKGAFGVGSAVDKRSNVPPALWWSKYGGECPELQKVAIRILSQSCDNASKFMLKRSVAENLLTKGRRNQKEQQMLSERIFLEYNMKLRNLVSGNGVEPDETSN